MKNKDAADGPATQLEPSSGVATDPFIIASFRAEGELTEGIGLITSYIWEGSGGPEFTPVRAQVKAIVLIVDCIGVVRYYYTKGSQNPSCLIFFFSPKAWKLSVYITLRKTFYESRRKMHFI